MQDIANSKLLLLQVGSLIYNFRWEKRESSMDRMRTVTSERYNTHTLHCSVKCIIQK